MYVALSISPYNSLGQINQQKPFHKFWQVVKCSYEKLETYMRQWLSGSTNWINSQDTLRLF